MKQRATAFSYPGGYVIGAQDGAGRPRVDIVRMTAAHQSIP